MSAREELAKTIFAMNYGELSGVATEFAHMVDDPEVRTPPKTTEDFASLLFDWAESIKSGL